MSAGFGLLILVASLSASFGPRNLEQAVATEERTAVATRDVRQAIENVNSQWEKGALAGDAGAVAQLYAEDAVLLAPGIPIARGRSEIEARLAKMFGDAPFTSLELKLADVVVAESGEVAYSIGTFTSAGTTAGGEAWNADGKYLSVYRQSNGDWKLVADTWNNDM